jgi:hypothetical protein
MGVGYNARVVTDGLVFCLDAANPKSYPGSGTTWFDISGKNNHGTMLGGVQFDNINKDTMIFDGIDDYINIGTDPSYNNLSSITIEFVYKRLSVSTGNFYQVIFSNTRDCCGVYNGFQIHLLNATIASPSISCILWNANNYNGFNWPTSSTSMNISNATTINVWRHVVFSYDLIQSLMRGYVNGVLTNSLTKSAALSTNPASFSLMLGKSPSHNAPIHANIPIAKIYNRALSIGEIQQNFNALRGRFGI